MGSTGPRSPGSSTTSAAPRPARSCTAAECRALVELYDDDGRFRSTVDMARHRFGAGPVPLLRPPAARRWSPSCGPPSGPACCRSPGTGPTGSAGRRRGPTTSTTGSTCATRAGQTRSTPLLLRYGPGDWNALHRDLYGDLVFPLQVVIGLDRPGVDYTGGEFVVVEQRPRAQSRATATSIEQGHGAGVHHRATARCARARGWSAAPMRHGVSVLRSGRRRTLGLVFHDTR